MKPESLHALIIDQQLGELSTEAAELLEWHLAQSAEARAEAERIRQALSITQQTMQQHPELARITADESASKRSPAPPRFESGWLAKAAAVLLIAAVAGAGGFLAGRKPNAAPSPSKTVAALSTSPQQPRANSPWARYRIAEDAGLAGLQVVRVDAAATGTR